MRATAKPRRKGEELIKFRTSGLRTVQSAARNIAAVGARFWAAQEGVRQTGGYPRAINLATGQAVSALA